MEQTDINNIHLYCSDAMEVYDKWKSPVAIICDGPYGVNGFPGDLVSYNGLAEWYEPHIKKWSEFSTPLTTLCLVYGKWVGQLFIRYWKNTDGNSFVLCMG